MSNIFPATYNRNRIARLALPWIATLITALPFNRRLSRWLDQLIASAERTEGRHGL